MATGEVDDKAGLSQWLTDVLELGSGCEPDAVLLARGLLPGCRP